MIRSIPVPIPPFFPWPAAGCRRRAAYPPFSGIAYLACTSLLLQTVLGLSPVAAGLVFVPLSGAAGFMGAGVVLTALRRPPAQAPSRPAEAIAAETAPVAA
jgi:hypothetical protein